MRIIFGAREGPQALYAAGIPGGLLLVAQGFDGIEA